MINYANQGLIQKLADEINGPENDQRRKESLTQFEVYMDRMKPYVEDYLRTFYKEEDVKSLPVISSINLARRIVKQEASIYKCPPTRTFTNVSEEQKLVLEEVYKDMNIDAMLQKSNEYYKLQAQNNIQLIPNEGKLKIRVLLNHQFDVVPRPDDAEIADAYILSGFNKMLLLPSISETADGSNQTIADSEDYKSSTKMHVLWSDDFNFVFNENGQVIGGYTPNPIKLLPFVDISPAKDFEFFIRQGSSVTEFTIQFNSALTDMSQIVRMQGFAQAYMIASESMMPTSLKIGPMIAVKMPINPDQPEVRPEFGFASPNADIEGSMGYLESLIALFLTSRGLDPKTISSSGDGKMFTSGLERLLAMIEKFEATRSDFNVYAYAEKKIFKIVKAYLNTYSGTDVLKYRIAPLSENADIEIKFEEPEMIETEADKMAMIEKKLDLGLISKVEAIMYDREIPKKDAEKVKAEIDQDITMPEIPDVDPVVNG